MCLVALAWSCHPRWRLLMLGNRDEFHPRPTGPLQHWQAAPGAHGLIAGRDLEAGGTWMGLDALGRAAVVTNVRAGGAGPASGARSRGGLVLDYLRGQADAGLRAQAARAEAASYAPFNLWLADANACWYVGNHPDDARPMAPGVHGLSNGPLDAPWPKTRRLCTVLERWIASRCSDPSPLWQALADETPAPDSALPDTGVGLELERRLAPAFIRGPAYGTRASTLLAVDHQGQGWISERRFGPDGVPQGETTLRNTLPATTP